MNLANVIFQLNNNNYPYSFDRSLLSLGARVYVKFDDTGKPKDFYSGFKLSCIPYFVTWIAPSEWYVALQDKFILDDSFHEQVFDVVKSCTDKDVVVKALSIAAQDIRPEFIFKTSELDNSRLSVISTVVQRLDLCSKLAEKNTAGPLFHHYRPLVIYLLLTCFDRLGQPIDWIDFGGWLKSNDKKEERKQVAHDEFKDESEIASAYYDAYNKIYGASNSFYRFLHKILPTQIRRELLDSIWIEIIDNPPNIGNHRVGNDNVKEKYLYNLRNDYTHNAKFIPGVSKSTWPEDLIDKNIPEVFQQTIEQSTWRTVFVTNWPDILEKVVQVGLARYIEKIAQKQE